MALLNEEYRGWRQLKWGDLATLEYGKGLRGYQEAVGKYPVYGTNGLIGWHDTALCKKAGIIIGRKGAYRGVHLSKIPFFVIDTAFYLNLLSENVDLIWAYYQLINFDINKLDSGSAIPSTSREAFYQIPVSLPPFPTQRKISAILSAYDDLIENNTRRIAILEEMAQSLYREWFVHFRFPEHEKKSMVESDLGMIPDGWEVKAVGDVIETLGGGTPSTQNVEYWNNGEVIWYSPTDLTSAGTMFIADSAKKITELGLYKSSARLFPAYSVMMTSRATIGVIAINTRSACTNQGFITCIPNEVLSASQIYFWLAENKEKIISLASGATFKEINRGTFRKLLIIIPDVDMSRRFNELVLPICKQIENLIAKNANLRQTRDLLLPKLISGELDVEELEVADVEKGVAEMREQEPVAAIDAHTMERPSLWE